MRGSWTGFLFFTIICSSAGCGGEDPGGFTDDANPPTPEPSGSSNTNLESCTPEIGDLSFGTGNDATRGDFIQASFSYTLHCDAKEVGSTVRVKMTNLDADDPESSDAQVTYDLPVKSEGGEVCVIASSSLMAVDFGEIFAETTYGFDIRLIDSTGLMSDALKGEATFSEIEDEALGDCIE